MKLSRTSVAEIHYFLKIRLTFTLSYSSVLQTYPLSKSVQQDHLQTACALHYEPISVRYLLRNLTFLKKLHVMKYPKFLALPSLHPNTQIYKLPSHFVNKSVRNFQKPAETPKDFVSVLQKISIIRNSEFPENLHCSSRRFESSYGLHLQISTLFCDCITLKGNKLAFCEKCGGGG